MVLLRGVIGDVELFIELYFIFTGIEAGVGKKCVGQFIFKDGSDGGVCERDVEDRLLLSGDADDDAHDDDDRQDRKEKMDRIIRKEILQFFKGPHLAEALF